MDQIGMVVTVRHSLGRDAAAQRLRQAFGITGGSRPREDVSSDGTKITFKDQGGLVYYRDDPRGVRFVSTYTVTDSKVTFKASFKGVSELPEDGQSLVTGPEMARTMESFLQRILAEEDYDE